MARRAALILFSLAAIAGVAVGQDASAASADPTRYHGGGGHGGGGYKPNGRVSTYNPNTKRYSPVKTDSSYSYYRLVVDLVIRQQDTWSPDLTKPSLFQGVAFGDVIDVASGATAGIFQSWTVSTFVNAGAAGTLSQLVVELGPEVDDTIVVAGATDAIITNQSVADADNAVTGGTKQFRGATGEFIYRNLANGTISAHIEVWVPRLKSF